MYQCRVNCGSKVSSIFRRKLYKCVTSYNYVAQIIPQQHHYKPAHQSSTKNTKWQKPLSALKRINATFAKPNQVRIVFIHHLPFTNWQRPSLADDNRRVRSSTCFVAFLRRSSKRCTARQTPHKRNSSHMMG